MCEGLARFTFQELLPGCDNSHIHQRRACHPTFSDWLSFLQLPLKEEKCYIFVPLTSIFLASVKATVFSCLLAICISCVIYLFVLFAHFYVFIHFL